MLKTISFFLAFSAIFPNLSYTMDKEAQTPTGRASYQQVAEAPAPSSEEINSEVEITTHTFGFQFMGTKIPVRPYKFVAYRPKPQSEEDIRKENIRKHCIQLMEKQDGSFEMEMDRHHEFLGHDSEVYFSIVSEIIKDYDERTQFFVEQLKKGIFTTTNNALYFSQR